MSSFVLALRARVLRSLGASWLILAIPLMLVLAACGRADLGDLTLADGATVTAGDGGDDGATTSDGGTPDAMPDAPVTVRALQISPTVATTTVGGSLDFTARALFSDGTSADVTASGSWTSGATGVLSVTSPGVVKAIGAGTDKLVVSYGGQSAVAVVTVTAAGTGSLSINPPFATIAVGASQLFTATYLAPDGTSTDVTASASWVSSSPSATFAKPGVLVGAAGGSGTVVASYAGLSAKASFTVTAGITLTSIQVTPTDTTAGTGVTVPYTATGIYSDGSKSDLTATATWSSSSTATATISTGGVATTVAAGKTTISAASGGVTGSTTLTVTSASLVSITVSPSTATIAVGASLTLKAQANYSDGSSVDVTGTAVWSSDTPTVATVATGAVSGVSAGNASITASFGGQTGTCALTVSPLTLLSITISPANPSVAMGSTLAFTATGTYAGGGTRDITGSVLWATGDATIASISNATGTNGVATPIAVGTTTVTATLSGVTGTTNITVTTAKVTGITVSPNPLNLQTTQRGNVTAKATYSDGTSLDVTTSCTWTTADTTIATVSNASGAQGQVVAVAAGSTNVTCTFGGATGTGSIVITSPTAVSITVSPIAPTCKVGDTLNFAAVEIDSAGGSTNVTRMATWTTSPAGILTPGMRPGQFTCTAAGTATVTATNGAVSGSTTVTVTAAVITSLQVDPVAASIAVGSTQQFQAVALYSDGTSATVTGMATWTSSNTTVAGITTGGGRGPGGGMGGLATALAAGTTTITATYSGFSATAVLTVTSAVPVSISINPASDSVAAGSKVNYSATAIYSDGTSKDVTQLATWTSSNTAAAQVSDARGTKGQATTLAAGATTITATWSGLSGTASLTVTAATISSIQVTPFTDSVAIGTPVQYRAVAIYSDGTSSDVTNAATWLSSSSSVAADVARLGHHHDHRELRLGERHGDPHGHQRDADSSAGHAVQAGAADRLRRAADGDGHLQRRHHRRPHGARDLDQQRDHHRGRQRQRGQQGGRHADRRGHRDDQRDLGRGRRHRRRDGLERDARLHRDHAFAGDGRGR
jgi:uncharacterized protein YjdB